MTLPGLGGNRKLVLLALMAIFVIVIAGISAGVYFGYFNSILRGSRPNGSSDSEISSITGSHQNRTLVLAKNTTLTVTGSYDYVNLTLANNVTLKLDLTGNFNIIWVRGGTGNVTITGNSNTVNLYDTVLLGQNLTGNNNLIHANYYQTRFDLVIQKKIFDAIGQPVIVPISPAAHIGEVGGYMYTQQYIADGVGGNYPIHTVDTSGFVYIDSKVVRAYTLGDFFAVWGEPLGVNNTLGFKANYSSTLRAPYIWSMCIRTPSGGDTPEPAWGAHVIRDKEIIDLVYSQLTCG